MSSGGSRKSILAEVYLRGQECPIHVADGVLGKQCKICAFFNGVDEQGHRGSLGSSRGVREGDKAFHDRGSRAAGRRIIMKRSDSRSCIGGGGEVEQGDSNRTDGGEAVGRDAYLRDDRFRSGGDARLDSKRMLG